MMINSDKVINVIETLFPELSKRECEFLFLYSMPSSRLELRLLLKTRLDFFFISQALNA